MTKADALTPKTWLTWTDILGHEYTVGDTVAVAGLAGKSAQLVIGEVARINRINSKGEEIFERVYDTSDGSYEQGAEMVDRSSCTVTVKPSVHTKRRPWGNASKMHTYQHWRNVVKIMVDPALEAARIEELKSERLNDLIALNEELRGQHDPA